MKGFDFQYDLSKVLKKFSLTEINTLYDFLLTTFTKKDEQDHLIKERNSGHIETALDAYFFFRPSDCRHQTTMDGNCKTIIKVLKDSITEMPLYINHIHRGIRTLAKWRLAIGR